MENKCDIKVELTKSERDLILIKLMDRKIEIAKYFETKITKEENEMLEEIERINDLTRKLAR